MTMLDDERLASLLARAGAAFDVPGTGVDDILARAAGRVAGAGDTDGADGTDSTDGTDGLGGAGEGTGDGAPALPAPAEDGRVRRLVVVAARHRMFTVAACVVVALAVAGTVGGLLRSPSGPTVTSGLAHPPRGPVTPSPETTTIPHGPSGGVSSKLNTGAPRAFGTSNAAQGSAAAPPVTTPTAPTLPGGAVGQSAKIEQTGTLGLAVGRGRLARTMTQLTALAGAYGGFVANSQTQSGAGAGGAPYGSVTLQVPVASFSAALRQAQALGRTSGLTTKATDVTGQYVDLQSRITALQDSRQQYLTILAKATTVGDVLAVQEQLDGIQSQIEQLQGQLQVLSSETSYSTLTVTVNEGTPPPAARTATRVRARAGLARQHRRVRGRGRGPRPSGRAPALRVAACLGVLLVGGPRPVAPLPAAPALTLSDRSPTPAGAPASSPRRCRPTGRHLSLTATVPVAAHDDGVEPCLGEHGAGQGSRLQRARRDLSVPEDVTTNAS